MAYQLFRASTSAVTLYLRNNDAYGNTGDHYSGVSPGARATSPSTPSSPTRTTATTTSPPAPRHRRGWNGAAGLPLFDLDGEGRVASVRVDIGADEYWPAELPIAELKVASTAKLQDRLDRHRLLPRLPLHRVPRPHQRHSRRQGRARAGGRREDGCERHGADEPGRRAVRRGEFGNPDRHGERCAAGDEQRVARRRAVRAAGRGLGLADHERRRW